MRKPRRLPLGLLGMLALVAAVEGWVARSEPTLLGIEPWDWRRTGEASRLDKARSSSILCFGDSLVKLGVRPDLLGKSAGGRSAYNLALCAGRAPSTEALLRRALDAGARPEAIVVDFNDSFLLEPPELTTRLYAELLTPAEVARAGLGLETAGSILAGSALRSARDRFEIRRGIVDALLNRPGDGASRAKVASSMRANWREHRGGQVMPKVAVPLPADPAAWGWVQPAPWRPDPANAAAVERFFALAEARGIPVFWLLPPLHPGFSARKAAVGLNAEFDAFVGRTAARHPNVVVVDGRGAGYDPGVFIDMAHLDVDGSARLSRDLGSIVADRLDPSSKSPRPALTSLPPFSAPSLAGRADPSGAPSTSR